MAQRVTVGRPCALVLQGESAVPDTASVKGSPVPAWRYGLIPLVGLLYPGAWLLRGDDTSLALVAAVASVLACGVGTLLVMQLRDRWTHEAHLQNAIAWSVTIGGALLPTFLVTGWLPSRRRSRSPDLHVETWAGRLTIGAAIGFALFLMFWYLLSPRRGGGWIQRRFAKQWGHGLCPGCGMAVFYGPEHPCGFCGSNLSDLSAPKQTSLEDRAR